jgi:hypothetical protein
VSDWRIGLFAAHRRAVSFLILCAALVILAGVIALASVLVASMSVTPTAPASAKFSSTAKVQSIAAGLQCVTQGTSCTDFDANVTYLNEIVVDSAIYSTPTAPAVPLEKTAAGWQAWATKITSDTTGSPLKFNTGDQLVSFDWGTHKFEALFTSGNDQRLHKLTRTVNVP